MPGGGEHDKSLWIKARMSDAGKFSWVWGVQMAVMRKKGNVGWEDASHYGGVEGVVLEGRKRRERATTSCAWPPGGRCWPSRAGWSCYASTRPQECDPKPAQIPKPHLTLKITPSPVKIPGQARGMDRGATCARAGFKALWPSCYKTSIQKIHNSIVQKC